MKNKSHVFIFMICFLGLLLNNQTNPAEVNDKDSSDQSVKPLRNVAQVERAEKSKKLKVQNQKKQVGGSEDNTKNDLTWISQQRTALLKIESCYKKSNCQFPSKDPKEYDYSVGQSLKVELFAVHRAVLNENIKDEVVAELARHFLKIDDGHVKEAALHILASQNPSRESLETLLTDVIAYHDPSLIAHAMLELQRYIGTAEEVKIHQAFMESLQKGSPVVAQSVIQNMEPFINEKNYAYYQKNLQTLQPQSIVYKQLKISIDEFKRKVNAA